MNTLKKISLFSVIFSILFLVSCEDEIEWCESCNLEDIICTMRGLHSARSIRNLGQPWGFEVWRVFNASQFHPKIHWILDAMVLSAFSGCDALCLLNDLVAFRGLRRVPWSAADDFRPDLRPAAWARRPAHVGTDRNAGTGERLDGERLRCRWSSDG